MGAIRSPQLRSINVLRAAAALAVVVLHVSAQTLGLLDGSRGTGWWTAHFVDSATRWAVPVFVLISGALLLDSAQDIGAWEFFRRRAGRVVVPLVFWSIVYGAVRMLIAPRTPGEVLGWFSTGSVWYHLWYLYMLVGLYLLTPLLGAVFHRLAGTRRWVVIGLLFLCSGGYSAGVHAGLVSWPSAWVFCLLFLGYYLAGRQIRQSKLMLSTTALTSVAVACAAIVAATGGVLSELWGPKAGTAAAYDYLSLPVVLMSLAVFALGLRLDEQPPARWSAAVDTCRRLGPATLGIYLIHPLPLLLLRKCVGLSGATIHPVVGIPVTSLAVFALSWTITSFLLRIPGLRRTVGAGPLALPRQSARLPHPHLVPRSTATSPPASGTT